MDKCCGTCRWIKPVLKASENDYWTCDYPWSKLPKPHVAVIHLQFCRNPGWHHLNVGDPHADYGKDCPTYEAQP